MSGYFYVFFFFGIKEEHILGLAHTHTHTHTHTHKTYIHIYIYIFLTLHFLRNTSAQFEHTSENAIQGIIHDL